MLAIKSTCNNNYLYAGKVGLLGVDVGTLVAGNSGRIPCIIILEQSK